MTAGSLPPTTQSSSPVQNRDPAAGLAAPAIRQPDRVSFNCSIASKELTVSHDLHTWLFIGANAYVEFTFVAWLNRCVYRRTVDYSAICIQ
jgi:hypothetical protein